jgi:uncharacterized lipoprotein YbaY
MPDIASYFVYFGSKTSQPVRARAFIDLAVQRLADNPDYVLSEEELRTKQGRRGRLVDKHATGRQTLR